MKQVLKIIRNILIVLIVLLIAFGIFVYSSPTFMVWYLRDAFSGEVSRPDDFSTYAEQVTIEQDIRYPSDIKEKNEFDLYVPVNQSEKLPVIFWAHGGAFVAGDKEGTIPWGSMITSNGYAFVSINYQPAPESNYPNQVQQVYDAIEYVLSNAEDYPMLDTESLFFGGDSAGAQIMSQYLALQTNPSLAAEMQIEQSLDPAAIRGAILFCGPYDLNSFIDTQSGLAGFFVNQIGWAFFGERNWQENPVTLQASTVLHVTENYPPSFITDGNSGSFEGNAKTLEAALQAKGVETTSIFYPLSHGEIPHEFQFDFDNHETEAMEIYEATLDFLAQYR